jgi:hypothetical protein
MEPMAEITKQLQEFRREISEKLKELRKEIAELRKQQAEILAELQKGKRVVRREAPEAVQKEAVQKDERQPATLEMYCTTCLEMKPIVKPKRVLMPDGSAAIQGDCSVCGTTLFRMTAMSGSLVDEAASSRISRQHE